MLGWKLSFAKSRETRERRVFFNSLLAEKELCQFVPDLPLPRQATCTSGG